MKIGVCVFFVSVWPMNWQYKLVGEKNADLATIHNMEEVKTLNNMADLSKMVNLKGSYVNFEFDSTSSRAIKSN